MPTSKPWSQRAWKTPELSFNGHPGRWGSPTVHEKSSQVPALTDLQWTAAETIARRSRAFEQFLGHLQAVPELRQAPDLQDFFVLPELRRAQSLTCTGLYREALALWANAWQLQAQLGIPSGPDRPLLTLAGLAVCHQELEDPGEARACCEKALQLLGNKNPHPLLAPFLEAHVRLSWRLGLDKRQSEARLQALQEAGLTPTPPPSLKELLIKEVLD